MAEKSYSEVTKTFSRDNDTHKTTKTKQKEKEAVARSTPITDLITARRQLDEASRMLTFGRSQMQQGGTAMKQAWLNLEKKELELRDTFIRFNHFVKENYEKRERAKQKIEREKKVQEKKELELKVMEEQLAELKSAEECLDAKLGEYEIFRTFLQQVVDKSQNLSDIQGVLSRYDTLTWTRNELGKQQADSLAAVQISREQLTKEAEKQAQMMMGLHTELSDLRIRYESAKTAATKWENILSHLKTFAAEKAVETEQVRSACWNLYKTTCKLKKEPETVAEWDTEQQLVQITRRIQHLKKVTAMVKNKLGNLDPATNLNVVTSTTP